MKFVLLYFFLIVSSAHAFSQVDACGDPETPPYFPGGFADLGHWVSENMHYPQSALEKGISGKCYVKFIVGKDGVCRDFGVLKGVPDCPECDEEAIRLLKSMPKWNPGLLGDTPIDMPYKMPIVFNIK
jgi:protein TonB